MSYEDEYINEQVKGWNEGLLALIEIEKERKKQDGIFRADDIDIEEKTITLTGREELSIDDKVKIAILQSLGYTIEKVDRKF